MAIRRRNGGAEAMVSGCPASIHIDGSRERPAIASPRRDGLRGRSKKCSQNGLARVGGMSGWAGCGWDSAHGEWHQLRPGEGLPELHLPTPTLWEMQGQPTRRAGERPDRERNRRLRVLVVAIRSPGLFALPSRLGYSPSPVPQPWRRCWVCASMIDGSTRSRT